MTLERKGTGSSVHGADSNTNGPAAPGRRTLTGGVSLDSDSADVTVAKQGLSGTASAYPFQQQIESSFGRSLNATAHLDSPAAEACATLDAQGYAYGTSVAFNSSSPSLHTAAHEAAHTIQQSQGVQLKSSTGIARDDYEQHADAAADLVVAGRSAAHLFGGATTSTGVQKKQLQRQPSSAPAAAGPASTAGAAPAGAGTPAAASSKPGTRTPEQQAFFDKTVEANTEVDRAVAVFSGWLSSITIPYTNAWAAHQTGLKTAEQAAKDANALVLAVIMAGAGGALGGIVGEGLKNMGAGAALVDGVKDLAKMGSRQVGTVGMQVPLSTPAGFQKLPANPLAWSQAINLRVQTEVVAPAHAAVLGWQHALNTDPASFDMNFDPVTAVTTKLTLVVGNKTPLKELKPENEGPLQAAFEKGFLNDWIESQAFAVSSKLSQASWGKAVDKIVQYGLNIGMADVRQRINKVVGRDTAAHNERVKASGHGLI